jgi:hypothetical protein
VYTLSGQILINTKDRVASAILSPDVTVTTGAGKVFTMPEEAIQCPSLVVPAGGSLTCNFAASYAGRQPMPGTVAASVRLAGVLIPITLDAAPVLYDFSRGDVVETGAFGTASNYFEMGEGIIQPYGVYGEQPPPGLRLEDSRVFSFVAVFGNVPSSKCGRSYKVSDDTAGNWFRGQMQRYECTPGLQQSLVRISAHRLTLPASSVGQVCESISPVGFRSIHTAAPTHVHTLEYPTSLPLPFLRPCRLSTLLS